MIAAFELSWLGGPAERCFRRLRPGVDAMPWGTLDPEEYPPELVARARAAWTESTFNEYCTAAAFAELVPALLAIGAPVDLVGMAAGFVVDEMLHVELNARMAMELGGGADVEVDFSALVPASAGGLTPLQRANELVVRASCVGESFSVPMLAGTLRAAAHPLTRAVLDRIVRDEGPHARFGWMYLDWVSVALDADERARLSEIATDAVAELAPLLRDPDTEDRYAAAAVGALGWMPAAQYARRARRAIRSQVIEPLAARGIRADLPDDPR